jgi:hypothetical protein
MITMDHALLDLYQTKRDDGLCSADGARPGGYEPSGLRFAQLSDCK